MSSGIPEMRRSSPTQDTTSLSPLLSSSSLRQWFCRRIAAFEEPCRWKPGGSFQHKKKDLAAVVAAVVAVARRRRRRKRFSGAGGMEQGRRTFGVNILRRNGGERRRSQNGGGVKVEDLDRAGEENQKEEKEEAWQYKKKGKEK